MDVEMRMQDLDGAGARSQEQEELS